MSTSRTQLYIYPSNHPYISTEAQTSTDCLPQPIIISRALVIHVETTLTQQGLLLGLQGGVVRRQDEHLWIWWVWVGWKKSETLVVFKNKTSPGVWEGVGKNGYPYISFISESTCPPTKPLKRNPTNRNCTGQSSLSAHVHRSCLVVLVESHGDHGALHHRAHEDRHRGDLASNRFGSVGFWGLEASEATPRWSMIFQF